MTTKGIAEVANVAERTARDWVAKASAKSAVISAKSAEGRGVGADYSLDETIFIIRCGGRDTLASLLEANARGTRPAGLQEDRLDRLEGVLENLVNAVALVVRTIPAAAATTRHPLALPPPPEIQPRDALRQIVDDWARAHGRDFHGAWANLYREYTFRYHRDLPRAARSYGGSVLDYADSEDLIGGLLALAYYLYGNKESIPA